MKQRIARMAPALVAAGLLAGGCGVPLKWNRIRRDLPSRRKASGTC